MEYKELRQIDALVAKEIMGLDVFERNEGPCPPYWYYNKPGDWYCPPVPSYTKSMRLAWKVVEIISEPPRALDMNSLEVPPNTFFMNEWNKSNLWAMSEEGAAFYICKIALEAVGIDIERHLTHAAPDALWTCENCAYDHQQSGAECVNCNSPAPVS